MTDLHTKIYELPALRNCAPVFRDRTHAGEVLSDMLTAFLDTQAAVLAIPAGGVPVAAAIARRLGLPLDVMVVSKVLLPWTTEAGYGAVAFDGSVWVNDELAAHFRLKAQDIKQGIADAKAKVQRRVEHLHRQRPFPDVTDHPAILVDDGLASGSTMRVAVESLRKHGPKPIIIAVPTGHSRAVTELAEEIDALYCANIRSGVQFAVADAYENWYDEDEETIADILRDFAG